MARIIPDDWQSLAATGAAQRERDTLAMLESTLPDAYTVYHGVHWTRPTTISRCSARPTSWW